MSDPCLFPLEYLSEDILRRVLECFDLSLVQLLPLRCTSKQFWNVLRPSVRYSTLCALERSPLDAEGAKPSRHIERELDAFKLLGLLTRGTGDAAACEAVAPHLNDGDKRIRELATKTLACIVGERHRGCERPLLAIRPCLAHEDACCRAAAFVALGSIAARGCDESVGVARAALSDPSSEVRAAALVALQQLAPAGCPDIIAEVAGCVGGNRRVREAAASAIGPLAGRAGSKQAIAAVLRFRWRPAPVADALMSIARCADSDAASHAVVSLCVAWSLRDAEGNPGASAATLTVLADVAAGLKALGLLTEPSEESVVATLIEGFADSEEPRVREAAQAALAQLFEVLTQPILAALRASLQPTNARRLSLEAAAAALGAAISQASRSSFAVDIVFGCLQDECPGLRLAAMEALGAAAASGDVDLTPSLRHQIACKDPSVRRRALDVACQAATAGCGNAVEVLAAAHADQDGGLEERFHAEVLLRRLEQSRNQKVRKLAARVLRSSIGASEPRATSASRGAEPDRHARRRPRARVAH